jgi:hypothetical protein
MRATRRHRVGHCFVPDRCIARILQAGAADAFVLGIFASGMLGFGKVYLGVAQRAIDLALAGIKGKTALAVSTITAPRGPRRSSRRNIMSSEFIVRGC